MKQCYLDGALKLDKRFKVGPHCKLALKLLELAEFDDDNGTNHLDEMILHICNKLDIPHYRRILAL